MRYGIFSDIHSNLEAFEEVLNYYQKEKVDQLIFLGDIIGYGANPLEVISILKELNPVCIAGNHDWAVIDRFNIEYFNPYAEQSILWTKKELKREDILFLDTLPISYEYDNFICVHGNLKSPKDFYYITDMNDAMLNFPFLKKRICFIGHSHKMEVYCLRENGVFYTRDATIKLKPQEKYIINVGSIGQPRDRDHRACLCIYDSDEDTVFFKRLEYNIDEAAGKIIKRGFPSIFALRLYSGW